MRLRLDEDDAVGIGLAPLIDAVFLLLVFFLVATVLEKPVKQVSILFPKMESGRSMIADSGQRVLAVDKDGKFHLEGTAVTRTELIAVLDLLEVTQPQTRIRLDVDQRSEAKYLAEILELLRQRNLSNIGLRAAGTVSSP